jgi:succinyl-CoA synthetase alpha subunit
MAILINKESKVLVQGITGKEGSFHTKQMKEYGTNIVAGTSPGKQGQEVAGVPVYDSVEEAVKNHDINASILFVPARFAKDAIFEAIAGGIKLIVVLTEHIPLHEELAILNYAKENNAIIAGPNTYGLMSPGKCKLGIMPSHIYMPGNVGIMSRSGTLSYEVARTLTQSGIGQSTIVGRGGDRMVGLSCTDVFKMFEEDEETKAVVLIGEIGGSDEEDSAEFISKMKKPVIAYIAGKHAPVGKTMGHAGAIVERGKGTYQGKVNSLQNAGALIAQQIWDVAELVKKVL